MIHRPQEITFTTWKRLSLIALCVYVCICMMYDMIFFNFCGCNSYVHYASDRGFFLPTETICYIKNPCSIHSFTNLRGIKWQTKKNGFIASTPHINSKTLNFAFTSLYVALKYFDSFYSLVILNSNESLSVLRKKWFGRALVRHDKQSRRFFCCWFEFYNIPCCFYIIHQHCSLLIAARFLHNYILKTSSP